MGKPARFMFLVMLVCGIYPSAVVGQTTTQSAPQEHRQLGPHQHGHGQFNVVMEGRKVQMELHIPGHDITGFEHKPSTPAQVAAMKKAQVQLKDGLQLFVPSAAAQCKLVSAGVETASEKHDEDGHGDGDGGHMEFHAKYTLDCNDPQKLERIRFEFFKAYPSAQVLEVMIINAKGQRAYDITAANPVADMPVQ